VHCNRINYDPDQNVPKNTLMIALNITKMCNLYPKQYLEYTHHLSTLFVRFR